MRSSKYCFQCGLFEYDDEHAITARNPQHKNKEAQSQRPNGIDHGRQHKQGDHERDESNREKNAKPAKPSAAPLDLFRHLFLDH